MNFVEKIKLLFTANKALDQLTSTPKASWKTGEFWVKVATAVCTLWAGANGFVPHPYDIYITVGLAVLVSLERLYLKNRHLETVVDLSSAPVLQHEQLVQTLNALVAKFPKLAPYQETAEGFLKPLESAANTQTLNVSVSAPAGVPSVLSSPPASPTPPERP